MAVINKEKKKLRPARMYNVVTREISYVKKGAIDRSYPLLKSDVDAEVELDKAGNLPGDARPNVGKPVAQTAPKKPAAKKPPVPGQPPEQEPQEEQEEQPAAPVEAPAQPAAGMVLPTGTKVTFQQGVKAALDALISFAEMVGHAPEAIEGQAPSPPEMLITEMNKVGDLMGKALESYPGLKISHGKPEPVAPTDDSQPEAADKPPTPQETPMAKSQELLAECDKLAKELELAGKLLGKLTQPQVAQVAKSDDAPRDQVDVQAIAKAAADNATKAVEAKFQPLIQQLTAEVNRLGSRTESSQVPLDGGPRINIRPVPAPTKVHGDYNKFLAQEAASRVAQGK
jgi:hypothetical protein